MAVVCTSFWEVCIYNNNSTMQHTEQCEKAILILYVGLM